jgi:hypothetical protein
VTQAPITADLHQPFDIKGNLSSQIPLNLTLFIYDVTQPDDLLFREIPNPRVRIDSCFHQNGTGGGFSDAIDVSQANFHPFFSRQINARDSRHEAPPYFIALFYHIIPVFAYALGFHKSP